MEGTHRKTYFLVRIIYKNISVSWQATFPFKNTALQAKTQLG